MTRMEKYASYREQILNEEQFLSKLETQNKLLEKITNEINDLNPNILNSNLNFEDKDQIVPFQSIEKFDIKSFDILKNYINTFNSTKAEQLINQIQNFINEYENNNLIDENGNISKEWLKQLKDYNKLIDIGTRINEFQQNLINFQTHSQTLINKLNETVKKSQDNSQFKLSNNYVEEYQQKAKLHNFKKAYFISLWILLGLIVILIGLIIAGVLLTW